MDRTLTTINSEGTNGTTANGQQKMFRKNGNTNPTTTRTQTCQNVHQTCAQLTRVHWMICTETCRRHMNPTPANWLEWLVTGSEATRNVKIDASECKSKWWNSRMFHAHGTCKLKVRPHLHTHTNEAGRGEEYANICLDCNTRQNVVVCRASEWFSFKYRLQADSIDSASDRTEAVFLSSVTHLHCYACHASACLTRVFVLMWMRLNATLEGWWNGRIHSPDHVNGILQKGSK